MYSLTNQSQMTKNQTSEVTLWGHVKHAIAVSIGFILTPIKVIFLFMLSCCLPARGKRVLLITSLWCLIFNNNSKQQQEALARLNDMFAMVQDPNALQLPALLYHALWNEGTVQECVDMVCPADEKTKTPSTGDVRRASEAILELTPRWLRYGRREDMIRDIANLLTGGKELKTS